MHIRLRNDEDEGNSFLFSVVGGQRAVVYNRITGVEQIVKAEGMHFKVPMRVVPDLLKNIRCV